MADIVSESQRSYNMSRIRGKDTKPELKVRSLLHKMGYRFRLHAKNLPGKPDIVLKKHNTAIFVHGCFWHRHKGCKYAYKPKSNVDFWEKKFDDNVKRHREVTGQLKKLGWYVYVIWECETKNEIKLNNIIKKIF